ncbi:MAG: hypothetical protein A2Z96_03060 [Spirochaetes bacterium GWB1_48_6]|nr:MAG: hypothetical protein A2Z96_03060 [Spirochaetes bacterium GWB1_48_6]
MNPEILAFIGLLILSALFSGSETAFTSLSPEQIARMVKKYGSRGRLVESIMSKPELMISTILIGNNIVNTASASLAAYVTLLWFGDTYLAIGAAAVTFLTLIFGEVTPKQIAIVHNEFIAIHTVRALSLLSLLFSPLSWFLGLLSALVVQLLGGRKVRSLSLDGLLQIMATAQRQGILGDQENRFVRNMFRIKDTSVRAFVTHRTEVFSLDQDLKVHEALPRLAKAGYSRVPLFKDNSENITGVLLLKDLISITDQDEQKSLKDFSVPPVFVPASKKARDMFLQFQKGNFNLAVVLDEYQSLLGVVTREDVIEEIMGELYDEGEESDGERITHLGPEHYQMRGDTPLHLVEEVLQVSLGEVQSETLAGFLSEYLGRLPQSGDHVNLDAGQFTVKEVLRHKVRSAEFIRKPPKEDED